MCAGVQWASPRVAGACCVLCDGHPGPGSSGRRLLHSTRARGRRRGTAPCPSARPSAAVATLGSIPSSSSPSSTRPLLLCASAPGAASRRSSASIPGDADPPLDLLRSAISRRSPAGAVRLGWSGARSVTMGIGVEWDRRDWIRDGSSEKLGTRTFARTTE